MSNSVSRFTTDSYTSSNVSSFHLFAYNASHVAYIVFNNVASATKLRIYKRDLSSETYSYDLTKDQITHLLSLDCPDAFVAYALTLCPCPPEIPLTNDCDVTGLGMDGGNLINEPSSTSCPAPAPAPAKSAAKGQGFSYLETLKSIKAQINELNKVSFEKSIISDAENYALLSIEMQLDDLISFDLCLDSDPLPDIAQTIHSPDCPICLEPCDREQIAANGGCCNHCYQELSNFSFVESEQTQGLANDAL